MNLYSKVFILLLTISIIDYVQTTTNNIQQPTTSINRNRIKRQTCGTLGLCGATCCYHYYYQLPVIQPTPPPTPPPTTPPPPPPTSPPTPPPPPPPSFCPSTCVVPYCPVQCSQSYIVAAQPPPPPTFYYPIVQRQQPLSPNLITMPSNYAPAMTSCATYPCACSSNYIQCTQRHCCLRTVFYRVQ